jgi:hypothetical protein
MCSSVSYSSKNVQNSCLDAGEMSFGNVNIFCNVIGCLESDAENFLWHTVRIRLQDFLRALTVSIVQAHAHRV